MGKKWIIRMLFITGLLLLCYPLAGNVIWRQQQKQAIETCRNAVESRDSSGIREMREQAEAYNSMLFQSKGAIVDNMDTGILSDGSYQEILDQSDGIMGSIEIPKIDVDLPVYHGTADEVLSAGAGHLQGTSLPVGGENTHCVLTGHRGIPGSRLFTRLDELVEGDLFFLQVLGETLAYRICGIRTVEPDDAGILKIEAGKDLCSLVTCTPYGINTHRLVVTGERVPYEKTAYESITSGIPSLREQILTAMPFVFSAGAAAVKITDWRKKKNDTKTKKRKSHVSGSPAVRDDPSVSSARIRRRKCRRRRRKVDTGKSGVSRRGNRKDHDPSDRRSGGNHTGRGVAILHPNGGYRKRKI